jgi:hypothetical protein
MDESGETKEETKTVSAPEEFPFSVEIYKKCNPDLIYSTEEEYVKHYEEIGKYQMRIADKTPFHKNRIKIVTTRWGIYIANALRYVLFKNHILSYIVYQVDPKDDSLHIILFSQKVNVFPKNYIIYQLEQKGISHWVDKRYETSIYYSLKTIDYSWANIVRFSEVLRKKISYYPIPLIPMEHLYLQSYTPHSSKIDVLFYGTMNHRRRTILEYIGSFLNHYKLRFEVIQNKFGDQLYPYILASTIVLNLHAFDNANLETCRLCELCSMKRFVISESYYAREDNVNYHFFKDFVVFVSKYQDIPEKIYFYLKNKKEYDRILQKIPYYVSEETLQQAHMFVEWNEKNN